MLFDPITVGSMELKHRVVMAPLTRRRAHINVPTADQIVYYRQRAAEPGTLLISEATPVRPQAGAVPTLPGIWTLEQAQAWKKITDAVHEEKSYIFLQLWALGRKAARNSGIELVSASSITMEDGRDLGKSTPRALTKEEIHAYVQWYAEAAKLASNEAGFDGVEIHSANGYLLEQFIRECTNQRTDEYGGSIENRTRFTREVVDAVVAAVGGDTRKVGIRLSPWGVSGDMAPTDVTLAEYSYLLAYLQSNYPDLAYVSIVEPRVANGHWIEDVSLPRISGLAIDEWNLFVRLVWKGVVIRAGGLVEDGERLAAKDPKVLIGYGRYFISNPDLPYRLKHHLELVPYDRSTFYTEGPKGFTDYPFAKGNPVATDSE